jgi:hypothetical protein
MKAIYDANPWYNYPREGDYYTHDDGRHGKVIDVIKEGDGSEGTFTIRFDDGKVETFLERELKTYK